MHRTDHSRFRKRHDFVPDFSHAERRTRIVIGITAAMMILEIVVGLMSHSMALLADGWHMSTHVLAFLITAVAYHFARTQAGNARFSFGTGKIGVLGGFTSAVVLAIVALLMAGESLHRLFVPLEIHFNEAIGIACLGLLVNLGCALLLADRHHEHDGGSAHDHDLNLRAAYLHVLADAFTSILAITALAGGKFFGWAWLDPVVGIVGSVVVFSWSYTLLRDTGGILLDRTPASSDLPDEIRRAVESDGDSVGDRSACVAGRYRKICRDGFDRRARTKELRVVSSAAAWTSRTGPRDDRDAPLPRRPRVGRTRLGVC